MYLQEKLLATYAGLTCTLVGTASYELTLDDWFEYV